MPLITSLEQRFGRFAIPGILHILAGLQVVTLVSFFIAQFSGHGADYLSMLVLVPDLVLQGQVWRLVSFLFLPGSLNPIFGIINALFLVWIGGGLERAWGAFRLNLYVIAGWLFVLAAAMLTGSGSTGFWLFESFLFAFAYYYPDEEISLYFIIPVKIKWIAWFAAAYAAFRAIGDSTEAITIFASNLNFLVAFGPAILKGAKHRAEVSGRRQRFEASQRPDEPHFHKCSVCGQTEKDDRYLDFRVNKDGEEICSQCRKG